MNTVPLSALVITHNEENNIKEYLENMSFADEIIVVDSYSTDKTVEIANSCDKVTVYMKKFEDFSSQKNYAISKAKHDWVMFFDADERIGEELKNEILHEINYAKNLSCLKVKRDWYFMGKKLKYSGFQNDLVARVFKKEKCNYNISQLVHERLIVRGTSKELTHTASHYSYQNIDQFNNKLTQYVELQARELYSKNIRPTMFHFFVKPSFRFFHHYIQRLGFLDGLTGFIIAYYYGFSIAKRYIYLWAMYRKINI